MKIEDFFDPYDKKHLEAWCHLSQTGAWKNGFLPEGIEFFHSWRSLVESKMADAWINSVVPKYSIIITFSGKDGSGSIEYSIRNQDDLIENLALAYYRWLDKKEFHLNNETSFASGCFPPFKPVGNGKVFKESYGVIIHGEKWDIRTREGEPIALFTKQNGIMFPIEEKK